MTLLKIFYHISAYIKLISLKILYGRKLIIGKGSTWRKSFSITISKSGRITIGKNCFFNNFCSLNALNNITIGDGTIFGENVKVYDHNHRFNRLISIKKQGYSVGEVIIGSNCWIASNVTILKGTVIGDNCVIGANVVVSGTVPSGTIMKMNSGNVYQREDIHFLEGVG